jgi:hypothetical protein
MSDERVMGGCANSDMPDMGVGYWVTPAVSYVDPVRRFCAYCGRPIARRYWERVENGREMGYCSPAHAAHTTYPIRSAGSGTGTD